MTPRPGAARGYRHSGTRPRARPSRRQPRQRHPTGRSGNINNTNNRRRVGPLQAIAPGPVQAIVFTPSIHVDYKHSKIKQYHKLQRAIRTETTINDTRDFAIGKRLRNLPALRQVGFQANRRLLATQRLGHDPIAAARALHNITDPVTVGDSRVAGLRFGDARAMALLSLLAVFRLSVRGFTNRDLRSHLAPLLDSSPAP